MDLIKKIRRLIYIIKVTIQRNRKRPHKIIGRFSDSYGNNFDLLSGLRDDLKPGWQTMVKPEEIHIPNSLEIEQLHMFVDKRIKKLTNFLQSHSLDIKKKTILEVGCDNGLTAYYLYKKGAKRVVGSDIFTDEFSFMKKMGIQTNKKHVELIKDSICNSKLPSNSFDFIFSFEVLEHLENPEKAFVNMHRILKDNGFMFHEYNPFFSSNGGHALSTLDFRWGHVRLNRKDFIRYVNEIRPNEKELDINFYDKNLNRMTLAQLKNICNKAGFKILSCITWSSELDSSQIDEQTLKQAQRNYPDVSYLDLITPKVWVLLKK